MKRWLIVLAVAAAVTVSTSAQTPEHGIREFTESGSLEIPAGVSRIVIELWGAGGGGGGGAGAPLAGGPGGGGGGGGSGAYVRAALGVVPGEVYVVSLGAPGPGGAGEGKGRVGIQPGSNGGDSSIHVGTRRILVASGGHGGGAGRSLALQGIPGGVGGTAVPKPWMLTRPGNSGGAGEHGGNQDLNSSSGGPGGLPVMGTIAPLGSFGGAGGSGGTFGEGGGNGSDGGRGISIISW